MRLSTSLCAPGEEHSHTKPAIAAQYYRTGIENK